jgi:hypothetical protein
MSLLSREYVLVVFLLADKCGEATHPTISCDQPKSRSCKPNLMREESSHARSTRATWDNGDKPPGAAAVMLLGSQGRCSSPKLPLVFDSGLGSCEGSP